MVATTEILQVDSTGRSLVASMVYPQVAEMVGVKVSK